MGSRFWTIVQLITSIIPTLILSDPAWLIKDKVVFKY